jgi:iron-sulfur cluster repair protein YtfE (RIC family)
MQAAHLVNINELEPADLCNYLEHKSYSGIQQSLQTISHYIEDLLQQPDGAEQVHLCSLLFAKLKDEVEQLMRNDTLIIFPLIRNDKGTKPCTARKLPVELIRTMNQKIMQLLERIRHQSNNYISKSTWGNALRICNNELYQLEQQLQQVIYIKENSLLPKVEKLFNQDCKGGCKHKD